MIKVTITNAKTLKSRNVIIFLTYKLALTSETSMLQLSCDCCNISLLSKSKNDLVCII